jgi:hypothetical protein
MGLAMKGNILKARSKELDVLIGLMVQNILVNFSTTIFKVKVLIHGLINENM